MSQAYSASMLRSWQHANRTMSRHKDSMATVRELFDPQDAHSHNSSRASVVSAYAAYLRAAATYLSARKQFESMDLKRRKQALTAEASYTQNLQESPGLSDALKFSSLNRNQAAQLQAELREALNAFNTARKALGLSEIKVVSLER